MQDKGEQSPERIYLWQPLRANHKLVKVREIIQQRFCTFMICKKLDIWEKMKNTRGHATSEWNSTHGKNCEKMHNANKLILHQSVKIQPS